MCFFDIMMADVDTLIDQKAWNHQAHSITVTLRVLAWKRHFHTRNDDGFCNHFVLVRRRISHSSRDVAVAQMGMMDMTNHVVGKMIGEAREEGECKGIKATKKCDVTWFSQLIIMDKQGTN